MLTLGIDLAAQPVNTAAVLVDWTARSVVEVASPATDEALLRLATTAGVAKIGIDAPLGFPERYVRSVETWHALGSWPGPPPGVDGEEWKRVLRFRRTDRHVHQVIGKWPLSVSSDLLAIVAWRCFALLSTLAVRGEAIDRRGVAGRIVEVYPAAANALWEIHGAPGTAVAAAAGLAVEPALAPVLDGGTKHARDALVCALLARSAALHPNPGIPAEAMREGWIHLPPTPLAAALEPPGA